MKCGDGDMFESNLSGIFCAFWVFSVCIPLSLRKVSAFSLSVWKLHLLFSFCSGIKFLCSPACLWTHHVTKGDLELWIFLFLPSGSGVPDMWHHVLFYAVLDFKPRALSMLGRHSTNGTTFPIPRMELIKKKTTMILSLPLLNMHLGDSESHHWDAHPWSLLHHSQHLNNETSLDVYQ